jgi:hypothetical protein
MSLVVAARKHTASNDGYDTDALTAHRNKSSSDTSEHGSGDLSAFNCGAVSEDAGTTVVMSEEFGISVEVVVLRAAICLL